MTQQETEAKAKAEADAKAKAEADAVAKAEADEKAKADAELVPRKELNATYARMKQAERERDELAKKFADEEKAKLSETDRVKKELEEQTKAAERGKKALATVERMLEAEMKSLPDNARALVPEDLSPEEKLEQVQKIRASGLLGKEHTITTPGGKPARTDGKQFTSADLQRMMRDPVEYDKNKDAIQAQVTANGGRLEP